MLKRTFDSSLAYRVVIYLRMSSELQNKRSLDQQLAEIKKRLKSLGYKWVILKIYRDDAKSGRYIRKRSDYQQMMRDIKTGAVAADLILVDTIERFGRVEELPTIRKELFEKFGVLVLTGDTNFSDPNSPAGKAMGMFEAFRATEHGRILAHNVLRGKRDAVSRKHWPGSSPPFGYRLKSIMKTVKGREEVDYCNLIPDLETAWIIQELFNQANATSWGRNRLAKWLTQDPNIPNKYKPFIPSTISYWLNNPIYYGELLWEKNSTGIVDDVRVVERNADSEMLRVPEFCEPIVEREIWDQVQAICHVRRQQFAESHGVKADTNGKQIAPLARGLSLKYLLSGLIFCTECGIRMTLARSQEYVTKSGEANCYASYVCPGHLAGNCKNSKRVPEKWLRKVVVEKSANGYFPGAMNSQGTGFFGGGTACGVATISHFVGGLIMEDKRKIEQLSWLPELVDLVNCELAKLQDNQRDQRPALTEELKKTNDKIKGFLESIAKPDLPSVLRTEIESEYAAALERRQEIEISQSQCDSFCERTDQLVDESEVIRRLEQLEDVLATNNPTMGNLHLSLHIDRIDCGKDGKVIMRSCKLGTMTEAVADFADPIDVGNDPDNKDAKSGKKKGRARRRGRLRVKTDQEDGVDLGSLAEFAADTHRFAGLGDDWFWTDNFQVPDQPPTWVAANGEHVFRRRQEAKLSHAKLAAEFGVSKPTIRAAIQHYLDSNPDAKDEVHLAAGGARPIKFDLETFADEARQLWENGWSKLKLAEKYGCSTPTIDKALAFAYHQDGLPMPTREDRKKSAVAAARRLHDEGQSLEDIARELQVSDVTARSYLKASYKAEGKRMPDLRFRNENE